MSESSNTNAASAPKPILIPSPVAAHEHGIPKGKHVAGHKIVVEGHYFAGVSAPHGGGFEKKKIAYREEFTLRARDHKLHAQGALGHILKDDLLRERLSSKDKNFRAIQTHKITHHENILVDAPAPDEEGLDGDESTEQ